MGGMAVFETPSPPERWIARDVVRIVDPLGTAIAWVDPALAGACIGFSVREGPGRPWREILRSDPPERTGEGGSLGLAPVLMANAPRPTDASTASWVLLERDPTGVTIGSVDRGDDLRVIVSCDERAVEMTVIGAGFAGFQMGLAMSAEGEIESRWSEDGAGCLLTVDGPEATKIEHSRSLRSTVRSETAGRSNSQRIELRADREQDTGTPLFARLIAFAGS